jgi:hypothetical protein
VAFGLTELRVLGLPVICIDARHVKAVLKMQVNKSDRNDAAGIARIMQTGWFKEVRLKGFDSHAIRALLTSRAMLVKIKRDLENQICGLLKIAGLLVGTARGDAFSRRALELAKQCPELGVSMVPLLATREVSTNSSMSSTERSQGLPVRIGKHDPSRRCPASAQLLRCASKPRSTIQPASADPGAWAPMLG